MLRQAGPDDVEVIVQIESTLFDNSMGERLVRHELELGRGWVYGEPVEGYILLRPDGPLTDITRLGVTQGARGKGIGQKLLSRALEGAGDVVLTVAKDNVPAMRLYKKNGFAIVGHLHAAGAWVMRRATSSPT